MGISCLLCGLSSAPTDLGLGECRGGQRSVTTVTGLPGPAVGGVPTKSGAFGGCEGLSSPTDPFCRPGRPPP